MQERMTETRPAPEEAWCYRHRVLAAFVSGLAAVVGGRALVIEAGNACSISPFDASAGIGVNIFYTPAVMVTVVFGVWLVLLLSSARGVSSLTGVFFALGCAALATLLLSWWAMATIETAPYCIPHGRPWFLLWVP